MEFGFGLSTTRGGGGSPENILRVVRRGEELGFDIVTVPDHVIIPQGIQSIYPYSEDGAFAGAGAGGCLEQLSVLSFLAAATSKIRLLTSVMVLPHRHPVLAAKTLATIDVLSGGRLIVGTGAGWMKEEFEALGAPPFEHRGSVAAEFIEFFKELWTSDDPTYDGDYAQTSNVIFEPKPLQKPHPPIWVGGESPPALRRAGRHADAWYPIGSNPNFPMDTLDRLSTAITTVRNHAERAGRNPATMDFAYSAGWYNDTAAATNPDGTRRILTGTPDQVAADLRDLNNLGINHFMLGMQGPSPDASLDRMERFAGEVRPKV